MEIKQNLVPSSKYSLKCPHSMSPIGICVHNTANDAPAKNEISYMVSNANQTSFHYAVDDLEAWQGVPTNRNAWHAGDGANGDGNRKYIGIEICYSESGGDKFTKAEDNAAELIAQLLKERGWGIDRVRKHQDFSGKYCPHRTLDLGWDRFLKKVESKMGGSMDCIIVNDDPGKQLFSKLVHNSDVADQTVKYLGLADKADNVDFSSVKNSLEAREGKLTTCKNELSTRDSELAKALSEVSNREEQVGRLKEELTKQAQLHKAELDALKSTIKNPEEIIKPFKAEIERLTSELKAEAIAKGQALNELAETKAKLENAEKGQYGDLTFGKWLGLLAIVKWS